MQAATAKATGFTDRRPQGRQWKRRASWPLDARGRHRRIRCLSARDGVEIGLFPRTVDRILIAGFSWLVVSGLTLGQVVLDYLWELLLLALAVVAYWSVWTSVLRWVDMVEPPRWLTSLPSVVARTAAMYFLILCGLFLVVGGTFLISVVLAQPIIVAERLGKEQALKDKQRYSKGCRSAPQTTCFEFRRGSVVAGRGFLIESSPEHLAIFDVALGRVRVIPRQGLESTSPAP
jgi:hypothetical protein